MDPAASHMGDTKTFKNTSNVNKSIFEVFSELGLPSEVPRTNSCVALVQHLAGIVDDESDDKCNADVAYCLKRLVRGLGGVRQPQQKGYFTGLVAVLDNIPSVSCQKFIETVDKELGGSKNTEEKESTLGVALAYGAAIRGGLFGRSSADEQRHIVTTLISCGKKKSYMPYVSSSFLLDLIQNCDETALVETVWPILKEEVSKPWEDQSLDSLLILLAVFNRAPNVVKSKTVQKWLSFPLFSPQSMQHFAQKLVNNSTCLSVKHPVYDAFCQSLCTPNHEALLETFWIGNVDKLIKQSNRNKDLSVLRLLTILLKILPSKQIEVLVTPHTLEVIGRILRAPAVERKIYQEIHSLAREAISKIGDLLCTEDVSDKIRLSVLKKILFDTGNLQYEKQTGTHISILLENKLSKKGVQKLAKQFSAVVDGTSQVNGQVWTNKDRKFAAQQLTRLIGHQACSNEIDWKVEQLLFLLHHGVFRQESSSAIGVELASTVRQCFFRALDQKFPNIETMISVLSKIVHHVNEQIAKQEDPSKSIRIPFNKEATTAWHKMMKTVSRLEKKTTANGNKESAERIFHVLFLFMGLQLMSNHDMAAGSLQELHSCYERIKDGKRDSKQTEEPEWVEVTIDLFLSLLSHDSHLLRRIVGTVFHHLSRHLSVSSFCQILEVLDPEQNANPLTSAKDMDDSESDSSSDDDTESGPINGKNSQDVSSAEESEGEAQSASDVEDGDDDEDEDDEGIEDFDEDMDETINDKLRQEVRYALGNAASLTDTESVDLDDIDEEEGQRMDQALANAFKTLKQSRSSKKSKKQLKSDEAVTHFRNRVLDLIEIYISREPAMDICLECITPLLSLLAFSMKDVHQKPLETKTRSILRKLSGLKKFSSMSGVDEKILSELIKSLAVKGVRSASTFLGLSDLISDCCTFLVRCSEIIRTHASKEQKPAKTSPVATVYESLLIDFFSKRDTLLPHSMFRSVVNLQWSGCWSIVPIIVQYAFDPKVRPFRRGQAIELLSLFLRNNHLLKSATDKQKQSLQKIVNSIVEHSKEMLNLADNDGTPRNQLRLSSHITASTFKLLHQILTRTDTKPSNISSLSSTLESFCRNCGGVTAETRKAIVSLHKLLAFDISTLTKAKRDQKNEACLNGARSDDSDDESDSESIEKTHYNNQSTNGTEEVKSRQKKQNGLKGKNKKDKKLQRLALMGEGLDSVTFCSVSDNILNGLEPDDDENTSEDGSSTANRIAKPHVMSSIKRKSVPDETPSAKKKKKNKV